MFARTIKNATLWVCAIGLFAGSARAQSQNWADQLVEKKSHDFGYVPRNGKYDHEFVVKNVTNRRVHIASATPSCPVCTITKPEKEWLEPGESTVIKASINTRSVLGHKDVTITVAFDQPSRASTLLKLHCYSRSDIVFSENEIGLGVIKKGQSATKTISIAYAGTSDWRISGAACNNPAIDTELVEVRRGGGLVDYELRVTVKPDAPPGVIRDRVWLGVNDSYNKSGIEVALNATVRADVSLSTSALDMGNVAPGASTSRQVIVRGVRPFKITDIEGNDGPIHIDRPDEAKQLHILTATVTAGDQLGDLRQQFEIKTDMHGEEPLKLTVTAKVALRPGISQVAN
jgi:adenosyl cobinamide kinase/adenosyl cobinamide phosphate guanylyltransferase